MRKVVCTLNVGRDTMIGAARRSIREAARRWGADFVEILTQTGQRHHYEEKLHLDEHFADGDRVLYYDSDVLVRKDCPSPFRVVPAGHLGLVRNHHPSHSGTTCIVNGHLPAYAAKCGVQVSAERDYPNTGMVLFELPLHRPVFEKARGFVGRLGFDGHWAIADQGNMCCAVAAVGPAVFWIPPMFEMCGEVLWAGWTAEMKTWGYHFCGPMSKEIAISRTCWDDLGTDRSHAGIKRWTGGRPVSLMTGELTYLVRELARVWRGRIVEVGTYLGGSAWIGGQIARDNWTEYHCVDTWSGAADLQVGDAHYEAFRRNMRDANLDGAVKVHRKPSMEAAAEFEDESLDLVFLDGDHSRDGCLADIRAWWPKLKASGVMLGHDHLPKYGVPEAVAEAFGSPAEVSWGDYPIWKVPKSDR